jgi:hypothetical protein
MTIKQATADLAEAYTVTIKRTSSLNEVSYQVIGEDGLCGTVEVSTKRYSKQGFTGKTFIANGNNYSNLFDAVEQGVLGF